MSAALLFYFQLSNLNTPIHRWHLPNIPEGFTVHIKRDDLTSAELSGNKVQYEPRHEKTNFLHMRKQRRRSASR